MSYEMRKDSMQGRDKFTLYRRLFVFARPYRLRLITGVVAGILSAGTFFGLLSFMPDALTVFSVSDSAVETAQEVPPAVETAQEVPPTAETAREVPSAATAEQMPDWFTKAEKFASKFNLPLRDQNGDITWQLLVLSLLGIPVVAFLRIATSFANHYFMRYVGSAVVRDIRSDLFATLQRQSLKFFGKSDVGQLISSCVNDTANVENVVSVTMADAAKAPFEILAALVFAILFAVDSGHGRFMLAACLLLPLCLIPIVFLGQRVKRWTKRSLERISFLVSRMHENFTGIRVVKAFNTEKHEEERFNAMNEDYFKAIIKALKAEVLMSPLMETSVTILGCGFVIACFIFHIKLSDLLVIGVAVIAAYRPLKQLARIGASLQRAAAALDRIFTILDADTSLPEPSSPVVKKTFDDRVVFDHVSFRFTPDGPEIAHDVCFEVPRGALVALVGETGSGKSTLANLLARFYDPVSGAVLLDGINLKAIATGDLRKLIGVVTQDTILFNDTVANNISYGSPDASREEIVSAAKMANAHAFISAHPEGYERVCGEKGFLLSGGEKQRIALARAILKNPPILILDEATSALDTVTERLVQEAIAKVMANRTVLAIAHRLSTVRDAAQILVIDKGRIVESGTHDELYAREGRYRRLCDMQLQG